MEEFAETCRRVTFNRSRRNFPDARDPRARSGALFPEFRPKFGIDFDPTMTVFTIGSCFARNIEDNLRSLGVNLPTTRFSVPKSEHPNRANGLLNEYNVGTISSRIANAMTGSRISPEVIVPNGSLFADLALAGSIDVTYERAVARQAEIFDVYTALPQSDVVIITLGLIEAWYDRKAKAYLNRMPPLKFGREWPERYRFKRLGVRQCLTMLEDSIKMLSALGKRIVLTVSPVPLSTTFSSDDCVVANEYSKSVLRVCAQALYEAHANVDYFPSFEIVRSMGRAAYLDDNVHVKDGVVRDVTQYMVTSYKDYASMQSASGRTSS